MSYIRSESPVSENFVVYESESLQDTEDNIANIEDITQGQSPLNTGERGDTLTFEIPVNSEYTIDELEEYLENNVGDETEFDVTMVEGEDGNNKYQVTIQDPNRNVELYEGGLLFKNGANIIEDAIVFDVDVTPVDAPAEEVEDNSQTTAGGYTYEELIGMGFSPERAQRFIDEHSQEGTDSVEDVEEDTETVTSGTTSGGYTYEELIGMGFSPERAQRFIDRHKPE